MFELAQTVLPGAPSPTSPRGILDANELALLKKAKGEPVVALRELRQKWDTLVGLVSKGEGVTKHFMGVVGDAYKKFGMFYEGVMTVPKSFEELKQGKMYNLLGANIKDYYELKREHQAAIKPQAPQYDPTTAPPVPKPPPIGMPSPFDKHGCERDKEAWCAVRKKCLPAGMKCTAGAGTILTVGAVSVVAFWLYWRMLTRR